MPGRFAALPPMRSKGRYNGLPKAGCDAAAELLQGLVCDLGECQGGLRQVHQHAADALTLRWRMEVAPRRVLQLSSQFAHIPAPSNIIVIQDCGCTSLRVSKSMQGLSATGPPARCECPHAPLAHGSSATLHPPAPRAACPHTYGITTDVGQVKYRLQEVSSLQSQISTARVRQPRGTQ